MLLLIDVRTILHKSTAWRGKTASELFHCWLPPVDLPQWGCLDISNYLDPMRDGLSFRQGSKRGWSVVAQTGSPFPSFSTPSSAFPTRISLLETGLSCRQASNMVKNRWFNSRKRREQIFNQMELWSEQSRSRTLKKSIYIRNFEIISIFVNHNIVAFEFHAKIDTIH